MIVSGMVAGMSVEEIAESTGLSVTTVYREKRKLIVAKVGERDTALIELRERELLTLDQLQRSHWQYATRGAVRTNSEGDVIMHDGEPLRHAPDEKSARVVLSCVAQRAKLLGLDAPVKIDLQARSQLDAQIEALIEELEGQGLVKS